MVIALFFFFFDWLISVIGLVLLFLGIIQNTSDFSKTDVIIMGEEQLSTVSPIKKTDLDNHNGWE